MGTPTLEAGETFIVDQPVPDAARKPLARRFLTPQPKSDPFKHWLRDLVRIVSRAVDGGVEFKRDDGTFVVARPNSDNRVGRLRPGTRADLAAGRLSLFGVSEKVTAIIVTVPRPSSARTLNLTASQVVSGIQFPAGSTLHMTEDGSVDRGNVPVPTRIADMLLVGEFEIGLQGIKGTLAGPAEIDGVPCAAGKVSRDKDWGHEWPSHVECILARGTGVNGHDIAENTKVAVSSKPSGERQLNIGTLAHAELLFDVTWPAGNVLHASAAWPQRLAHVPASPGEEVLFCTPEGQDVSVPGVVLHGKVGYDVRENGRALESCDEKDRPDDHDGLRRRRRGPAYPGVTGEYGLVLEVGRLQGIPLTTSGFRPATVRWSSCVIGRPAPHAHRSVRPAMARLLSSTGLSGRDGLGRSGRRRLAQPLQEGRHANAAKSVIGTIQPQHRHYGGERGQHRVAVQAEPGKPAAHRREYCAKQQAACRREIVSQQPGGPIKPDGAAAIDERQHRSTAGCALFHDQCVTVGDADLALTSAQVGQDVEHQPVHVRIGWHGHEPANVRRAQDTPHDRDVLFRRHQRFA